MYSHAMPHNTISIAADMTVLNRRQYLLSNDNAKFEKDTVIKAFAAFGGIDIVVPEDVQVKIKSGFIFGGVSDERKSDASKGKYTIYLDAAGGFGGVTINDAGGKKK